MPLFEPPASEVKSGRPRTPSRELLNGILWVLKTGAVARFTKPYPPYQTCHRRFQEWAHDGTMAKALHALAKDLHERGGIDEREAFIDDTFSSAKKRAWRWEDHQAR